MARMAIIHVEHASHAMTSVGGNKHKTAFSARMQK